MKTTLYQTTRLQGRLSMTFSLVQSLTILQMPQAELGTWLLSEIVKNPLLELEDRPLPFSPKDPALIEALPSLYDHLSSQIREHFPNPQDLSAATDLLQLLDERGFLPSTCPDSPLLSVLQSFDPPGIFARDLRECLLLQLSPSSLAYRIVSLCFKELLQGKFEVIQKKVGACDLSSVIQSLAGLHFRPADLFKREFNPPVIADLSISKIGRTWIVKSKDEEIPKFKLREDYLALPSSENEFLRKWVTAGKWLLRSLKRRSSILLEIGVFLVRKQAAYLDGRAPLQPLSIKLLAEHVHLHPSTLSRALADKYAETPRGTILLRSLMPTPSENAKVALQKLIDGENKKKPLSDAEVVKALQKMGVEISRRTVAKYRAQLKISPASYRRYQSGIEQIPSRKSL